MGEPTIGARVRLRDGTTGRIETIVHGTDPEVQIAWDHLPKGYPSRLRLWSEWTDRGLKVIP